MHVPSQDFEAIGIDKKGFQLLLEKEVKKLHSTKFKIDVPVSKVTRTSYVFIRIICMHVIRVLICMYIRITYCIGSI